MSISPAAASPIVPPLVPLAGPVAAMAAPADADTSAPSPPSPAVTVGTGGPAAPVTYAPTQYTDEVAKDVAALADKSGASLDDQLSAYVDLRDLLFNGALLFNAGNQQDLQNASDAYDNSALSKQIEQVGDQYDTYGMSAGRAAQASGQDLNPAGFNLSNIERFSTDQQKMLFVGLEADSNYDNVDDWKAGMQQNAQAWDNGQPPVNEDGTTALSLVAARFNLAGSHAAPTFPGLEALVAATAAANGLVVVHTRNGSPIAVQPGTTAQEAAEAAAADMPPPKKTAGAAATDTADTPPSPAAQALKTLTSAKQPYSANDIALQMLQSAAKAKAIAAASKAPAAAPQSPYQTGDNLSIDA